jgi:hypothetical protein
MSIREFVDSLKSKKKTELKSLYKKPVPETGQQVPKAQVFYKGVYQQGDILYLPEDKGYKFLLVIVDLYDNSVDAEPVKDILSKNNDVLDAFKKIYSRKFIKPPLILTLDKGAEFTQQQVKEYLIDKLNINIKYGLSGRSRQLAYVERMNQRIGSILLKRMASQELITGQVSKEWIDDIKPLIKLLNERKKKPLKQELSPDPIANEYNGNLLKIGAKVRLLLDKPIDNVRGKRLIGDFRSGDIRWTTKVYKITEILLKPGYPPMYLTDAGDNVARTKNQLQKVSKKDEEPDARFIRGNPDTYIISKILDKKIENRKTFYLVKWKGFKEDEATWEPSSILDRTADLRALRKKFNDEN